MDLWSFVAIYTYLYLARKKEAVKRLTLTRP